MLRLQTDNSFFKALSQNIPAKIMTGLAVAYGLLMLAERVISTWKKYRLAKNAIKKDNEDLHQEEIDTKLKEEKLK